MNKWQTTLKFKDMERVKKGEIYWAVYLLGKEATAICYREFGGAEDFGRFHCGNYFHTKEEAEAMAEKIRKVLKGADVIEMPSDGECEEESNKQRQNYNPMPDEADYVGGFVDAIEFLRSKIVK